MNLLSLDPNSIIVADDRQRKDLGDIKSLAASMAKRQLQPIVVEPVGDSFHLIAGQRRLEAAKLNGSSVWACLFSDLDAVERELIELEENVKRKDLTWQERCGAIAKLHRLLSEKNKDWDQSRTAEHAGLNAGWVSESLTVASHLADPTIAGASTSRVAYNSIDRKQTRVLADLTNTLFSDASAEPEAPPAVIIQQASFLEWAPAYAGQPFNFIHCDFPYGVGLADSDQMADNWSEAEMYQDNPELYWELLNCLQANLSRIAYPSCHVLFWFSMKFYQRTLDALQACGLSVNPFPLVWIKSDNRGILPDAKRGPRQIYETAFLCSRGDRHVIKSISNGYTAPSAATKLHPSEKPEPVLRYFFQMFVDERSRVLDPTAGSGSALRAADSMGAEAIYGLELSQEYCDGANNALAQARKLRKLSEKVG